MTTALVLDALEQAIWTRRQAGITEFDGLVHHNDAGSQSGRGTYLAGARNSGLGDCGLADDVEGAC
jgi:transposase InsO family protein